MPEKSQSSQSDFITAIATCLAYESGLAELSEEDIARYTDAAKWALGASNAPDELPQAEKNLRIALVSGGATKIKGYVFESAKLPEIRGASGLLDRINLTDLPALWDTKGFRCRTGIIYANGGEILAFAPPRMAADLADAIERIYTCETLVAQSVAVYQTFTLAQIRGGLADGQAVDWASVTELLGYNPAEDKANEKFGSLITPLALAKFRRREGNPDYDEAREHRAVSHFETTPFARRCSSCDRRVAVAHTLAGTSDLYLCEPCARKRIFGQKAKHDERKKTTWFAEAGLNWKSHADDTGEPRSWAGKFAEWLGRDNAYYYDVGDDNPVAPDDLNEIAQASKPEGYVGVVYADGNNMGALLERLGTPLEYAQFADAVYEATKEAVFEAIRKNLPPKRDIEDAAGSSKTIYPFEILSIGGDDLFLIVPADAALPIACDIAQGVEDYLLNNHGEMFEARDKKYTWTKAQRCAPPKCVTDAAGVVARQCKVSLSVGVVLAPEHTPVFHLRELAEALLKSAKSRAKQLKRDTGYCGGTVDFLSLKSTTMISDTVENFRKAALRTDHGNLYARPYTIAEMRALMATILELKASDFPKGQIHRLGESLRQGWCQSTVDYLYFLSRGDLNKTRAVIEYAWNSGGESPPHPWLRRLGKPDERETIWPDLIELYDFVARLDQGKSRDDGAARPEDHDEKA